MSRILLVYPPYGSVTGPYLSVPVLVSYLRSRGIPVSVLDANCEFYRRTLDPAHLAECRDRCADTLRELNALDDLDRNQTQQFMGIVRSLFDAEKYAGEFEVLLDHNAEFGRDRRIPAIRAAVRLGTLPTSRKFSTSSKHITSLRTDPRSGSSPAAICWMRPAVVEF
jgi:hypothetical protein